MSALIEQQPIVVTPCMIKTYGATKAIFMQQLWYWQCKSQHKYDGKWWVYNTQEEWACQLGLSRQTIQTITSQLEKDGAIFVANYNKLPMDKTKWYSLNVDKIRKETAECLATIDKMLYNGCQDALQSQQGYDCQDACQAIPETTTKTTSIDYCASPNASSSNSTRNQPKILQPTGASPSSSFSSVILEPKAQRIPADAAAPGAPDPYPFSVWLPGRKSTLKGRISRDQADMLEKSDPEQCTPVKVFRGSTNKERIIQAKPKWFDIEYPEDNEVEKPRHLTDTSWRMSAEEMKARGLGFLTPKVAHG